ncbi:HNH endonuclease [Georgenia satyanarayanai]|uniref:HNH endonuclease n=1 Tax=Georgenia satyanarayanai TaxID=860221 RepID=UPI00203C3DC9|nr:HNH endonuclease [Georgenia satyanarayanai]MCM3659411.1 HNH endonuclease [Georgenia satyanarayanai]
MTSWVLTIDKNYPNHWDIAKEHKLWDMATARPIKGGDVVYFWVSQYGFIGRAEVAESAVPLSGSEDLPWTDDGERQYVSRFRFGRTADAGAGRVTWTEVQENTGFRQSPSWAPHTDDSVAETWLASLFRRTDDRDAADALFDDVDDAAEAVADLGRDLRERTLAQVKVRRGQGRFRKALVEAYGGRCAVTGSTTEEVLEAAHISPYRGEHTNIASNGLLLRADIHTLFDLNLITVVFEGNNPVVRVSPDLREDLYRALDGRSLAVVPSLANVRPDRALLRQHNQMCEWIRGRGNGRAKLDLLR